MRTSQISNWGNYPLVNSTILNLRSKQELSSVIKSKFDFIARGNGGCYGDSSLSSNIISTLKFNKIIAFDTTTGIISCQSGITFDSLIEFIIPKGWFLPVTPGTKYITLGGAVASDIHGKNHHVEGSFKNHIISIQMLLSSGEIVECSNELNQDLFKATCGGMGLTGIILEVRFKLKKIESAFINEISIKAKNLEEIFSLFEEYKDSMYTVAWIDCLQSGKNLGRSLLMVGEHASANDKSTKRPLQVSKNRQKLRIPFYFPEIVLNRFTVMIFNFLFYHKQLGRVKRSIVSFDKFFYPLDFIKDWNKMYGRRGFVQYQFVLPLGNSKEGLHKILTEIGKSGMGSFLAVLKLFGESDGLINFPMRGYTLALDFPIRKGLFEFLDDLDKIVLQYGGRLYLTKDARMKREVFWNSYPNAREFKRIIEKFNPDFKWRSIQSDRLGISKL